MVDILFEDNHLIAVNKKPGELVQGDKTGDESLLDTIKAFIKERDHKPGNVFLGLIHRLDRPTSGVVTFAKTSKALTRMNQLFKTRKVDKIYWAICEQNPALSLNKTTLTNYLKKNPKSNKVTVYSKPTEDAKKAVLHYVLKGKLDNFDALEISLETGRSHQIRAQLSKIKSPIKGDLKYGAKRSNPDKGISLHARSLSFVHPIKNESVNIVAKPPKDNLWNAVIKL